ncbi:MAG TPA: ABC transporter ATP-binding protein [Flavobacteriales bacterium]|jgi:ATP-binding cassette subfamily B protein|nr:ABC transporter ATP-binding protein [Flavobacteriales bacterium]
MSKTGEILDYSLLKRVMGFSEPYKSQMWLTATFAILLAFLAPLRPLLINYALDEYILIPNLEMLFQVTILMIAILAIEAIVQFYYIYYAAWIGQHVIQDLRGKIYKHIVSLKLSFFDKTPIGTVVTRTISDIETIAAIFSEGLLIIIAELLKIVAVLAVMFYTDVKLTIVSLASIPLLLIATSWFKRSIKSAFQQVRTQVSVMNAFIQEHIVGMNIVQIFVREHAEYQKFKKINKAHQDAHLRSILYYSIFFPVVEILSASSIGLIIWWGGSAILYEQEVTFGELVAFILYIHMLFRPIRQLADRFNILQMGIVGSDRVFKILDTDQKIQDNGDLVLENIKGDISFRGVFFAYNRDQWVLKDINFDIEAGKTLSVVGETGAGKTSVTNVLNRFYDIQKGSINIDGYSIEDVKLTSLRKQIAFVQQEVFLFSDSIFNNITLYDEHISIQRVEDAAKQIGIHDFINSLPGGYNYSVGERGITLSTGQRQLIAFLRVYVRNPKILILDEATSSIDTETEQLLQNALEKLAINRTLIIIAHRLSTIRNADKILLFQDGKIIEQGTHNYLMQKKGVYQRMYSTQQFINK